MLKNLSLYTFCHVYLLFVFWWQAQQAGCWLRSQDESGCKRTELIVRLLPPRHREFSVFGQSFQSQCFGLKYQANKILFETEGDKYIPQILTLRKKYFQFLLGLLMFFLKTSFCRKDKRNNKISDLEKFLFSSYGKCPFFDAFNQINNNDIKITSIFLGFIHQIIRAMGKNLNRRGLLVAKAWGQIELLGIRV